MDQLLDQKKQQETLGTSLKNNYYTGASMESKDKNICTLLPLVVFMTLTNF